MLVVIDTNVIVSAFWSRDGNPAKIVGLIQNGLITSCYDHRIIEEYEEVLSREKFGFSKWEINDFLAQIKHDGMSIVAKTVDIALFDESDRKFYEVAKQCGATLITGNIKHFPPDSGIMMPVEFLREYEL
jgi:putative PIN family toxin of toxin-antitoxin system